MPALANSGLRLPSSMAAAALLVFACLIPLGPVRREAAVFAASAVQLGGPLDPAGSAPISLLLGAAAVIVPFGDLATRIHAVSTLFASAAVALMVVFLGTVLDAVRPRQQARSMVRDFGHEPIAMVGAIAVVMLAPGFSVEASQAGPGAVAALALIGGVLLVERVVAFPSDARRGLGLALLCGLAAGV